MRHKFFHARDGFTLVETMVAIGLFVMIAVSSVGLFFSAQGAVARIYDFTRLETLNRLMADTVLADIRTSAIVGGEYSLDADRAQSRLVLSRSDGTRIVYEFRSDDRCSGRQGTCLIRTQGTERAVIGDGIPISVSGSFLLSGLAPQAPEGKAYVTIVTTFTPDTRDVSSVTATHSARARYGL